MAIRKHFFLSLPNQEHQMLSTTTAVRQWVSCFPCPVCAGAGCVVREGGRECRDMS